MRKILQFNSLLKRPLVWLQLKFTRQQFLIISAVLIGTTAGLAATVLKTFVHYLTHLFKPEFHRSLGHYAIYLLPLIGLALTVWIVKRFFKGNMGRGVAQILYEIAQRSSVVPRVKMYSQIITSAITVGFGGSSGLEAPIVVTGSAIGSNFGKAYKVGYIDRTLMLACGASAGIAAVFNSPVAGMLFSIEILLSEIVISAFIPLMVAAVSGTLVSRILLEEQILFHFSLQQTFNYHNVPYYILLGFLCGLASLYYARIVHAIEHWFKPLEKETLAACADRRFAVGWTCLLFPPFVRGRI